MNDRTLGIVGGGILGRLIAFFAIKDGFRVTLFEREGELFATGTSAVAAGMIAPYCEMEYGEPTVSRLGFYALDLWEEILKETGGHVLFQRNGSLVVAHQQDRPELLRLMSAVRGYTDEAVFTKVEGKKLGEVEPELEERFNEGLYFPHEGQIDSRQALVALADYLKTKADIRFFTPAETFGPNEITAGNTTYRFDMVVDSRGVDAKADLKQLRGVRGEVVRLRAPDVKFSRPVRMMHPRYPIYVVPREDDEYVIGATSIDNDDLSEISVRGTLELLTAVYSLHPGFSEARVMETAVQCRPAFPDNAPKVYHEKGLIRANGLYRHGYLATPKFAQIIAAFIGGAAPPAEFANLFEATA